MNTNMIRSLSSRTKPFILALGASLTLSACGGDNYKIPKVNKAPTVSDAMVITQTEVAIESSLMASDPEGDSLTYSVVSEPTIGQLTLNADGTYRYEPNLETTGTDAFEFAVSDGVNQSVVARVEITIEQLEVSFASYSRQAFEQNADDEPLRINGRAFTNTEAQIDFSDLVDNN